MNTYNNVIEYYSLKAPGLRDEAERIADDKYTAKILEFKKKNLPDDLIHVSLHPLRMIRKELFALRLHFAYLEIYLTQKSWWDKSHKTPLTNRQIFHMVEALDTNIKRGFVIGIFSVHEHSLREYLRRDDPSLFNNGKDSYWKIRDHYLDTYFSSPKEEEYKTLLKLFSSIRNCFHNDGIYFPYNENDLELEYRGNTYRFENEKPIDFVEWELLLQMTEDLSEFFYDLITNQNFQQKI